MVQLVIAETGHKDARLDAITIEDQILVKFIAKLLKTLRNTIILLRSVVNFKTMLKMSMDKLRLPSYNFQFCSLRSGAVTAACVKSDCYVFVSNR